MEIRAALVLELNKKQFSGVENRFADKSLLKKPPTPKELFTGRDMFQASNTLHFILVNIARYEFTVPEALAFIENVFSDDALLWFQNLQTDIQSQEYKNQIYRFVILFRAQYMNPSMAMVYEKQIRNHKLTQDNPKGVDIHYNLFTKLASNWRSCDYTILDSKLIFMYFQSLPIDTQRTIGVEAMKTCKNLSDLYIKVKDTATMISKYQPRTYERDVVSVNSMYTDNNNDYNSDYNNNNYSGNYNNNNYNNNYNNNNNNYNYKNQYRKGYQNKNTHFNSYDYQDEYDLDSNNEEYV